MLPFPTITAQDVIKLGGPQYMIDNIWAEEFGTQIEYRYRVIPYQLIYLLHKYGPVIPHGFFLESVKEVCGLIKAKPDSQRNEIPGDSNSPRADQEKEDLSTAGARQMIQETVELGLITEVIAPGDRRYRCYKVSEQQLKKFYRIREREAQVYAINDIQAANTQNPKAGKTEANASWYSNFMDMVNRRDAVFLRDKKKLDALSYLLTTAVAVFWWIVMYGVAAATLAGGTK
jgi:DNA-binding MarR family transcriptional regulator